MKEFWSVVQFVFTVVGGWLGYFLGGCDGLLYALIAFVAIDYITGVMCAINDKTLSSEVGFNGICRKVLIFLLVGIANILDLNVIGTGSVLRTAGIMKSIRCRCPILLLMFADIHIVPIWQSPA
ncbi:phage holin family protein [[Ruminococcus] torques]|uniref:phage holin family protein n=1 Tax=[Ruminococcus] torques TaxID=33039 RepID=UPI00265F88A9|nr:phage holin family protein [[Ruminococcus] torques]